jgi:hypothetical protein
MEYSGHGKLGNGRPGEKTRNWNMKGWKTY